MKLALPPRTLGSLRAASRPLASVRIVGLALLLTGAGCGDSSSAGGSDDEVDVDSSTGAASGNGKTDGASASNNLDASSGSSSASNADAAKGDGGGTASDASAPAVSDASSLDASESSQDSGASADAGSTIQDAGHSSEPDASTPGKTCGSRGNAQCGADQYCKYALKTQCGAADEGGVCTPRPKICQDSCLADGYCGCDGKSYCNECMAARAGTSVASMGSCGPIIDPPPPSGKTCGGIAGLKCATDTFCNYEKPNGQGCDGTISDAAGVCEAKPQACTQQYDPVCGCDGKTYGNACTAHSSGAAVKSKGACK